MALVALSHTFEDCRAEAWGIVGRAGAIVTVALAAALQAVDGIALKTMVDRWVTAPADQPVAFEAAFAVRQVEVGLVEQSCTVGSEIPKRRVR